MVFLNFDSIRQTQWNTQTSANETMSPCQIESRALFMTPDVQCSLNPLATPLNASGRHHYFSSSPYYDLHSMQLVKR